MKLKNYKPPPLCLNTRGDGYNATLVFECAPASFSAVTNVFGSINVWSRENF